MVLLGGVMSISPAARAQQYVSVPFVPQPDVYTFTQQNPSVQGLFGRQVTGQYQSLTIFGDSYADWGNARSAGTLQAVFPSGPFGRFSNGLSLGDELQYHYALATPSVANYAVAGATSGMTNVSDIIVPGAVPVLPGIAAEIQTFLATGRRFGPTDLVAIMTASGNDVVPILFNPAATPSQITAAANQSAANTLSNVQQLVGAGARNIAIVSNGDSSLLPIAFGNANVHSLYSQTISSTQASLAPLAHSGVRIFFFDLGALEQRLIQNPGLYGFTNVTTPCSAVVACANATQATQNQFLFWDVAHLTTAGFAVISRYQTNQIDAPNTVAAQGDIGLLVAATFSGTLFGRLDAYREQNSGGSVNSAYAWDRLPKKAPALAPASSANQLSVYLEPNYAAGKRADQLFSFGYNYELPGGTAGIEYRYGPNILFGGAFKYTAPNATLTQGAGHINLNSYQFAGYASLNYPRWFADFVATVGHNDYLLDRPGVLDTINAATSGTGFSAGFKAGRLFDVAALRVGPIIGLNYARAAVNGYTETGDPLLTQMVNGQSAEALTSSAGIQFRFGNLLGVRNVNPYLNLTAEHDFIGGSRSIVTTQTSAILLPITTPIAGRGEATYGKVAGGISATLTDNLKATINGFSTFARAGGDDFAVSTGLKYLFN
jgi:outer membrane lipase/esterase